MCFYNFIIFPTYNPVVFETLESNLSINKYMYSEPAWYSIPMYRTHMATANFDRSLCSTNVRDYQKIYGAFE